MFSLRAFCLAFAGATSRIQMHAWFVYLEHGFQLDGQKPSGNTIGECYAVNTSSSEIVRIRRLGLNVIDNGRKGMCRQFFHINSSYQVRMMPPIISFVFTTPSVRKLSTVPASSPFVARGTGSGFVFQLSVCPSITARHPSSDLPHVRALRFLREL